MIFGFFIEINLGNFAYIFLSFHIIIKKKVYPYNKIKRGHESPVVMIITFFHIFFSPISPPLLSSRPWSKLWRDGGKQAGSDERADPHIFSSYILLYFAKDLDTSRGLLL